MLIPWFETKCFGAAIAKSQIQRFCISILLLTSLPSFVFSQQLRIDHVIAAYPDLDEAIEDFSDKGFTIKPGRLHENGLINAHIKFQNESSFELMSLQGAASDDIARAYRSLIEAGVKGAYLALTGLSREQIEEVLAWQGIAYDVSIGKLWTYVTFPSNSDLAHVFFIIYHQRMTTHVQYTGHRNGAVGLQRVTIEGSPQLVRLMKEFDLVEVRDEEGGSAKFTTSTGEVVIHEPTGTNKRPRVLQVEFKDYLKRKSLSVPLE